jgi:hypothetical protein
MALGCIMTLGGIIGGGTIFVFVGIEGIKASTELIIEFGFNY